MEGGNIYFDKNRGAVIDCDPTVTYMNIPDIIDGVEVKYIDDDFLYKCDAVTSINIPSGITDLDYIYVGLGGIEYKLQMLKELNNLESINVAKANPIYSAIDGILYNKDGTELISYPIKKVGDYVISDSTIIIGDGALSGCRNIDKLTIPNSVTTLENFSFSNSYVRELILPDSINNASKETFDSCSVDVVRCKRGSLVDNKEWYGYNCSMEYYNTTSYDIVGGKIYIALDTGEIIDSDKTVTKGSIPDYIEGVKIVGVGERVFSGREDLVYIELPEGITTIGESAFSSTGISRLELPKELKYIDSYAFHDTYLSQIELPEGLISIGNMVFDNSRVRKVVIPKSVEYLNPLSFENIECIILSDNIKNLDDFYIETTSYICFKNSSVAETLLNTDGLMDEKVFYIGDADNDGELTAGDAAATLQKVLNGSYTMQFEIEQNVSISNICDVDGDGILTANDSAAIMQKVLSNSYQWEIEK